MTDLLGASANAPPDICGSANAAQMQVVSIPAFVTLRYLRARRRSDPQMQVIAMDGESRPQLLSPSVGETPVSQVVTAVAGSAIIVQNGKDISASSPSEGDPTSTECTSSGTTTPVPSTERERRCSS